MKYAIVVSSKTGNTALLGDGIKEMLGEGCEYFEKPMEEAKDADILFLGFWTDKGTADAQAMEFIKSITNKKIFLFGTAGFGVSKEYFDRILDNVKQNVDGSNEILGTYMCQGKMPIAVRNRYEKLKEETKEEKYDMLIANFDQALSHPDEEDLERLKEVVGQVIKQ